MTTISFILYIKDLLIFKSPIIENMSKGYFESAKQKGVYLGELAINPYIFESRSLDVAYLFKYLESLDRLAGLFRELYDEYIYSLRLNNHIDNNIYEIINNTDKFHTIFNAINNTFNAYLVDQYLFQDFGIYQSQTSLETCMAIYETFNDYLIQSLLDLVDPRILRFLINQKNIRYANDIYTKIFDQFEYIYLPFY